MKTSSKLPMSQGKWWQRQWSKFWTQNFRRGRRQIWINPHIDFSKVDVIDTADEADEWVINKNIKLAYTPANAFDSLLSCTSTEVYSLSEYEILKTFHLPIWSSLISCSKTTSDQDAVFEVASWQPDQIACNVQKSNGTVWSRTR